MLYQHLCDRRHALGERECAPVRQARVAASGSGCFIGKASRGPQDPRSWATTATPTRGLVLAVRGPGRVRAPGYRQGQHPRKGAPMASHDIPADPCGDSRAGTPLALWTHPGWVFTSGGVKGVTARTDNSGPRLRPSPAPAGTDIAKHHPVCGYRHAKALDCHPCPSRQGTAKGTNPSKKLGNMAHWPGGHASPARGTDERYGLSARHLVAGSKKVDACGSAVLAFPYRGASGRPPTRSGDEEGHSLIQPILGVSPDPSHRTRPPPGSHLLS